MRGEEVITFKESICSSASTNAWATSATRSSEIAFVIGFENQCLHPSSTMTHDRGLPLSSTGINKALLWTAPSAGRSSFVKDISAVVSDEP
ncbi:hypothetical protein M5689_024636 [Euphorbia peplus]|nr:hypothetical protein M5689_024636 [Euphorbia peplus]